MNIARKLKFAAFYLYLKWLRLRQDTPVLAPMEQRLFTELCKGRGLDPAMDGPAARSARNAFWLGGAFKDGDIAPQLDALVITRQLKFGNAILELTNAVQIARELGVRRIYHRGFNFLRDEAIAGDVQIIKGAPSDENYLASSFFENALLEKICMASEPRYRIARQLAPWLTLQQSRPAGADRSRHLYIHIRSGDIFEKSRPHPQYGQPPLSFYTRILRLERWEKVVLVFENRMNPTIDKLIEWLAFAHIPCEIQSANLDADASRLLEAENIVIGRGTFAYPMLCISDNVRRVFCFESDGVAEWGLDQSGIQFVRLVDKVGAYRETILTRWQNNDEQRELMLTYSEDNLIFAGE